MEIIDLHYDDNPVKIRLCRKLDEMVAPGAVRRLLKHATPLTNPNNTIFTQSSPRFKQMFMYMAGMDDEDAFDAMARAMTVRGQLGRVRCPTLLVSGEFDPLCPLEDALEAYEEPSVPKELWVLENQFHPLWKLPNLGSLDCHEYVLDWLGTALGDEGLPADHRRVAYVTQGGDGPWGDCEGTPPVRPGQRYF